MAPSSGLQDRWPNFDRVETPASQWDLRWDATRKNGCPGFWRSNPALRVWAKPRSYKPYIPAREKIAADLGQLLGLPVAPVLLTRIRRRGRVRVLALSRYARAKAHRKWSQVKSKGPAELVRPVRRWFRRHRHALAGIWVLDTWLGNHDQTDRNVMVAYDPDSDQPLRAVYFYDFDASQGWIRRGRLRLGNRWRSPRLARTTAAIRRHARARSLRYWIRRIEALPRRRLRYVIGRLPAVCLSKRAKRQALRMLLHRRRRLRRVFQGVLRR
ncbi:MAG TPA: hypothetical protein VF282_03520 [Bacillota bacterium]